MTEMMTEIKAVTKKEGDGEHPASHYLIVEDAESPSTWHLRVRNASGDLDHRLMGAAWAALHSGYRGNVYDGPGRPEAIAKLKRLYEGEDMTPPSEKLYSAKVLSQTDETAVVAGYGVVFGGQDLEGEYFTKDTDFMPDIAPVKPVFYDHALNDVKHEIGKARTRLEDIGIWVEAELDKHKAYVKEILRLIDEGVIGWSSGSVGHLIAREGKAIKRWPIVEFSLTATPAEPRTLGVERIKALALEHPELKALLPQGAGDAPVDATAGDGATHLTHLENSEAQKMADITMSADEYKELIKATVKAPETVAPPAVDPAVKALSDRMDTITAMIENSPVLKDAGYVAPDSEEDRTEVKTFGDFLLAVRNNNVKRIKSVYKTAMAEDAGATGGYLVPTPLLAPIIAAAEPLSVLRRAGATIINGTTRSVQVPVLDISTAPSAGDTAFAGGVAAVWEAEAGALDETEPRFRLEELVAHKLSGYSLASNEVRADSVTGIDGLLATMFGRAVGSKENYAFFRGDGVAKPLGILSSGALISASRSAASAIALDDLAEMMSDFIPSSWGKGAWFVSPPAVHKLIQLVSSPLSWMNDLRSGMPVQLLGMPLYVTGALPALNTAGDILLVDPSYYLIYDRQAMSIAYSEHYKFANDQGTWRFTYRVDGQPWVQSSITLENASSTVSPYVALAAG